LKQSNYCLEEMIECDVYLNSFTRQRQMFRKCSRPVLPRTFAAGDSVMSSSLRQDQSHTDRDVGVALGSALRGGG
jgi:hypothetical protein